MMVIQYSPHVTTSTIRYPDDHLNIRIVILMVEIIRPQIRILYSQYDNLSNDILITI